MKSGSAAKFHDAIVPQKAWNRLTSGGVAVKKPIPIHATQPSANAIHTPISSKPANTVNNSSEMPRVVTLRLSVLCV
jgi:hypothetical protein